MRINKLAEQLKEGTFYYYKIGLFIKSPVIEVFKIDDNSLTVNFNNGAVDVYLDTIKSIKRPSNIVKPFKWCYVLKNYYDEIIGYIGLEE